LSARATHYAVRMNDSPLMSGLKNGTAPISQYRYYIRMMYPVVVGFNKALVQSMSKIDNVVQRSMLSALVEQLIEEQRHNDLWRELLDAFAVDHDVDYASFLKLTLGIQPSVLKSMTKRVLECLDTPEPGILLPQTPYPQIVLALWHSLMVSSTEPDLSFWEHYACQFSIEAIIYDVVSDSIYPGIVNRPDLNFDDRCIAWWREHAKQGSEGTKRSDEEKHLRLARHALDRNVKSDSLHRRVLSRADVAMKLFVATAFAVPSEE
jgi:hypothetical protein